MATAALVGLGYFAYKNNNKPTYKEMLMASKQVGGVRKEYPVVLYENQSWQGPPRPLNKNELILIMEQRISEKGEITRKWHYGAFKTNPKTHIRFSADVDDGNSVKSVDALVGFNTPSIHDFIFNDHKIFGVTGLDLNSKRSRYTKVYMKVL